MIMEITKKEDFIETEYYDMDSDRHRSPITIRKDSVDFVLKDPEHYTVVGVNGRSVFVIMDYYEFLERLYGCIDYFRK